MIFCRAKCHFASDTLYNPFGRRKTLTSLIQKKENLRFSARFAVSVPILKV